MDVERKHTAGAVRTVVFAFVILTAPAAQAFDPQNPGLGLPPVPVPEDNPITPDKVELGKRLFNDARFSADGTISCATCHDEKKVFTDGLPVAEGIKKQKGTRNTPTVVNAAYFLFQFWDGRRLTLEDQAKDPFLNPVEHGLKSHDPIIKVIRNDPDYTRAFKKVFNVEKEEITIDHVVKAIAAFERTLVSGDSPFDRWYFGGDENAISEAAKRGFEVFVGKGRCQGCHTISQDYALFTDNKFHNLGVGWEKIAGKIEKIVVQIERAREQGKTLDELALTSEEISELGRYVVTGNLQDIGAFKTSTLRNIALTGPYMHDGSLETLEEVVEFYNQGGNDNPFLSGGIKPLGLTPQEKADLVEFLKALTSKQFMHLLKNKR